MKKQQLIGEFAEYCRNNPVLSAILLEIDQGFNCYLEREKRKIRRRMMCELQRVFCGVQWGVLRGAVGCPAACIGGCLAGCILVVNSVEVGAVVALQLLW